MSTVTVLLSDKRSGSTMLQTELCRHSGIRHVDSSPHRYFETHFWLCAAVMLDRPAALFTGGRTYDGYGTRQNARGYLVRLLSDNVPNFRVPSDDAEFVHEGWEALCASFGNPVFFEKSPQILAQWVALDLFLKWIEQTSREVRVIGLVRNPIPVLYSAQKLFATHPNDRQFAWLNAYRNLLAIERLLPPNMYRRVRYEDIIENAPQSLRALQDFLGVEADPEVGRSVHPNSTEKWKYDPDFSMTVDPALVRMAGTFGYHAADMVGPEEFRANPSRPDDPQQSRGRLWINRRRDRLVTPALLRLRSVWRRQW